MFNLHSCLQREKSFDCPFPICHLSKAYSQEILISCLFVFGRFILMLHSYSKHKPFKMLCKALFLFVCFRSIPTSICSNLADSKYVKFPLTSLSVLLALATVGLGCTVVWCWCSLKWNLILTKVAAPLRAKLKTILYVFNWSKSSDTKDVQRENRAVQFHLLLLLGFMKLVTWSLPFANIIWDAQTSEVSSVFCKAFEFFVSVPLFSWRLAVVIWLQTGMDMEVLAFVLHLKQHFSTCISTPAKQFQTVIAERSACRIVDDVKKNMYVCPAGLPVFMCWVWQHYLFYCYRKVWVRNSFQPFV